MNEKHQPPKTKSQRSSKHQFRNGSHLAIFWSLRVGFLLVFGVWDLGLCTATDNES